MGKTKNFPIINEELLVPRWRDIMAIFLRAPYQSLKITDYGVYQCIEHALALFFMVRSYISQNGSTSLRRVTLSIYCKM